MTKVFSGRLLRSVTALLAVIAIIAVAAPSMQAEGYTPSFSTLKIGLAYGSGTLTSGNLQNVSGKGSGYEFGYFDKTTREFISIGATTAETKISMLRDANMTGFSGSDGFFTYTQNGTGNVTVGCYHIQLSGSYPDFASASGVASQYSGGYVKYDNGVFLACVGNYLSAADAESAIYERGFNGASITSGTKYTIAVVVTGTSNMVFEFDGGVDVALGVRPIATSEEPTQTYFKGYKYFGAFQYYRVDGENIRVINMVSIEEYIKGLVPYEMGPEWPIEAIKAQACCARTYAMAKLGAHGSLGFDLCTSEHCQVYRGAGSANARTNQAVDETAGQYITYNGQLCETYYSSSDGGATEDVENVWSHKIEYLRGVIDPYEADVASRIPNYKWTVTYTPASLTSRMQNRGYSIGTITSLTVTQFTNQGNARVVTMKDSNGKSFTIQKEDIRLVLGVNSIRLTTGGASQPGANTGDKRLYVNSSSNELSGSVYAVGADGVSQELPSGGKLYAVTGTGDTVEVGANIVQTAGSSDGKVNGVFYISGTGKGHNVGMSQWGAYSMAEYHGKTYREIISFYYTGVTIG